MVLIPKCKGVRWGLGWVGLVKVTWKVCAGVVNFWLDRGVVLHDALHGFREVQGTCKTTLEANLAQQLSGIAHKPLFQVLLDIRKAYESLDRGQCLEVM